VSLLSNLGTPLKQAQELLHMTTSNYGLHVSGFKMVNSKEMLHNVASNLLMFVSDDREKPHQTSQLWSL
jgi:hypothetical protein